MAFLKRTKQDVKSKRTLTRTDKASGKKRKAGVEVTFKDGQKVVLLNPSGKGTKYANELKEGIHYTNSGVPKLDKKGNTIPLTNEQRAYRSAYITALSDGAKAYNAKKNNGGKS